MYESFFGLSDLPFRLTPDPRYLFMSAKHREAFAHLVYGIREGSGFVAITGEVGAGKTTLIRTLLADHASEVTVASIVNPVLTSTELLQTINAELGIPSRSTSRKELTEELAGFLKSNRSAGRRTVIIVDEAQDLDPVVMEQLRLLTNLETETEKLLQVVLVGQPELHGLLQRHDLRQLNQRVTERWHLDKLDRDEAMEYVRHRLRVAGAATDLVDPKALDTLYRYTGGVPRLLNILGHRSLLVAFTRSRGRVGVDEVRTAARELGYSALVAESSGFAWSRVAGWTAGLAACALVAFVMVNQLGRDDEPRARKARSADSRAAAAAQPEGDRQAAAAVAGMAASASPEPAAASPAAAGGAAPEANASMPAAPAVPTAVASPASPGDAAALASLTAAPVYDVAVADYSRLLQAWGATVLAPADLPGASLNFEQAATARGLRYAALDLDLPLLSRLDVPAMVEVASTPGAEPHYLLLRTIDAAASQVRFGSGPSLSFAAFGAAWNGRAHIVFRDPEELRFEMAPGAGGPAVRKLQGLLASVGVLDASPNGRYDDRTENAVRRFQESHQAPVDGVAGPLTQVLLYNSLARFERPTLAPGSGLQPARAQGKP